jgi:hypothetical protein
MDMIELSELNRPANYAPSMFAGNSAAKAIVTGQLRPSVANR